MNLPFRIRRLKIGVFLTFIGSAVFIAVKIITAPISMATAAHVRVQSDYVLMLLVPVITACATVGTIGMIKGIEHFNNKNK